jgi:hypothetical protein
MRCCDLIRVDLRDLRFFLCDVALPAMLRALGAFAFAATSSAFYAPVTK